MKIYYLENGSLCIELETLEDRIIFRTLHAPSSSSIDNTGQLTFRKGSCNTFIASPKSVFSVIDRDFMIQCYNDETKLRAVKAVKDVTSWSLKECKDYVDNIWDKIRNGTY